MKGRKDAWMSLKSFLTRLIWICVLPLVLLAAYLAVDRVRSLQSQRDMEAANLARNFATALDRHIEARIAALQVLAASSAMDDQHRLRELYQEAQAYRRNFDSHVVLADLSFRMIFNTRSPLGTALPNLPQVKGHSSVASAMASGKPAVGDMFFGPVSKTPLVSIAVPVSRHGRMNHLLLSVFETGNFQQRLDELAIPPGWSMTVIDGKNDIIARRPHPGTEVHSTDSKAPGRFVVKSALSPWSVVLEVPRGIYRAPIVTATAALAAAILAATLASVLGGMLAGRRLAREVASLAETPSLETIRPAIAEIEAVRRMLDNATTAREDAESTLRESEERLRLLGDNLPNSYVYQYLHDAEGIPRFLYLSAGVERVHGLSREDLLHDGDILHRQTDPHQITDLLTMEAACLESMSDLRMELRICRADGQWRWLEVRSRPRRKADGQLIWDGVATDITERKRAEMAVAENEARLKRAEEMAHLGHWRHDLSTGRISWSDEMYRIFGLRRRAERINYTVEEITRFCHPDDLTHCVCSFDPAGQGQGGIFEYRIIRPNGEERYVVSNGEIERNEHEEVAALFGTLLDATELKKKERELEQKNAEMERFTYTVSHDLKSPLVTVKSFIGFLEKDMAAADSDRIARDILFIKSATDRMSQLLDQILVMSRIGKVITPPVQVQFDHLVQEALALVAGSISDRGVLVRQLQDEQLMLQGDRTRLVEIWQNLIENAVKYMGEQPEPSIGIGFEMSNGAPLFFVADNGMGIDPRYHDKIFSLFDKLDPKSEGTGLGLALVKRIVEMYEGKIWVESEGMGKGSCFRFTLPLAIKRYEDEPLEDMI